MMANLPVKLYKIDVLVYRYIRARFHSYMELSSESFFASENHFDVNVISIVIVVLTHYIWHHPN